MKILFYFSLIGLNSVNYIVMFCPAPVKNDVELEKWHEVREEVKGSDFEKGPPLSNKEQTNRSSAGGPFILFL